MGLTMAGLAILIIIVLWFRGGMGRMGLVLAVLAGAALGGLDPIASAAYDATALVAGVAADIGTYASRADWGSGEAAG